MITETLRPLVVEAHTEPELLNRLEAIASDGRAGDSLSCDGAHACRLLLVATDIGNIQELAGRAAKRLQRRPGKPIHDVAGIYYYPEPLGKTGSVAWIFPGEGAQYLGMLAGLEDSWPESRSIFQSSDEFAAEIGGDFRSLSYFTSRWEHDSTREEAEAVLRRIDNAMLSVLTAGWCLSDIAHRLEVPLHATAGHSAGELAALMTSEAMHSGRELPSLAAAMHEMEQQSQGVDARLLAVAAPADRVAKVVDETLARVGLTGEAMVAMDNCPHQCIVVGMHDPIAHLTKAFEAEGWIVETLVLQQPYHTPMFAPLMGPLREAFERVEFSAPCVPVYSCASGERFPESGEAIRELSLAHWHSRVQFRTLIERMYEDGVRVFLEVGPRGNCSSFIADILRGRPVVTIPMDTPRLPTSDQIVHAAAQLAAHHVHVNLRALDPAERAHRETQEQHAPSPELAVGDVSLPSAPATNESQDSGRGHVLSEHWNTMQQMLDDQSQIMQGYLRGKRTGGIVKRRVRRGRRAAARLGAETSGPLQQTSALELPRGNMPLVGDIQSFVPGDSLKMQRVLDPAIEYYATHHTVGGREVSAIDPQQCGLPVMPMTFTLEMMMEAAIQLAPECVVRSINRVQLSRWLAFYERDPITIRIEAQRLPDQQDDVTRILVRVLDLGNREESFAEKPRLAAVGTVELATDYLAAPDPSSFTLTDAAPCETSLHTMYNNLFHGELFRGVTELSDIGVEGITSTAEVLPRGRLFNDARSTAFLGDPVLLDVAMHPNAAWHLEQADQTGRIMLPFEVKSVEFFGPRPAEGTRFLCNGRLDDHSARHFTHSVETIDEAGRVWNRINGVRLWRFYLPFHEVNFHGPKNVYHLSTEFETPELLDSGTSRFEWLDDLAQPTLLRAAAEVLLSGNEFEDYLSLQVSHEAKVRWMFGRVVAKDAVRRWWYKAHGERLYMADIETREDEHGQLVVSLREGESQNEKGSSGTDSQLPRVLLAHGDKVSLAIASMESLAGVDLMKINDRLSR